MGTRILMVANGRLDRQPGYFARIDNEIRLLIKRGFQIRLLAICSRTDRADVAAFLKRNCDAAAVTVFSPMPATLLKSLHIVLAIFWEILRFRPKVVHAEAFFAQIHAYAACKLTGCRNHYDVHGAMYYEMVEAKVLSPFSLKAKLLHWMDSFLIRHAGSKTFVSGRMLSYYDPGRTPWRVVPCCVDVQRFRLSESARGRIRERRGWRGKTVFCFLGNMNDPWQGPQMLLDVFGQIASWIPTAHLLVISPPLLSNRQISMPAESTWMTLRPNDVPDFLSAADVALLVREDLITNRVASPTKFGEYVATSLPVILSEGIGDYSDQVKQYGLGLLLNRGLVSRDQLTRLIANLDDVKTRCRAFAERELDWDKSISQIVTLYGAIA